MVSLAVEVAVVEAALMAEGLSTAGPHKDREGYCAGSRADTVPRAKPGSGFSPRLAEYSSSFRHDNNLRIVVPISDQGTTSSVTVPGLRSSAAGARHPRGSVLNRNPPILGVNLFPSAVEASHGMNGGREYPNIHVASDGRGIHLTPGRYILTADQSDAESAGIFS
eukprot:1196137-Prorocentrum_minimum.AAC.4